MRYRCRKQNGHVRGGDDGEGVNGDGVEHGVGDEELSPTDTATTTTTTTVCSTSCSGCRPSSATTTSSRWCSRPCRHRFSLRHGDGRRQLWRSTHTEGVVELGKVAEHTHGTRSLLSHGIRPALQHQVQHAGVRTSMTESIRHCRRFQRSMRQPQRQVAARVSFAANQVLSLRGHPSVHDSQVQVMSLTLTAHTQWREIGCQRTASKGAFEAGKGGNHM